MNHSLTNQNVRMAFPERLMYQNRERRGPESMGTELRVSRPCYTLDNAPTSMVWRSPRRSPTPSLKTCVFSVFSLKLFKALIYYGKTCGVECMGEPKRR